MLPIVPNMHDVIANKGSSPYVKGPVCRLCLSDSGSMVGSPSRIYEPPPGRLYSSLDGRYNYRHFPSSRGRSGQREFVQSVEEATTLDYQTRRSRGFQFNEDVEQANFLSSVVVVPKSSGQGYEVYKSTLPSRRENSISEDCLDSYHTSPAAAVPAFTIDDLALLNNKKDVISRNYSVTQAQSVVSKSSKFSRNITNPAMQKKIQEKLQEVRNRVDMFRSTRVTNGDIPGVESNDVLRACKSKPTTPTPTRKYIVSDRTSPADISSPLNDHNLPLARSSPTPKEQPSRLDRISYSPPLNRTAVPNNLLTAPTSQLERNSPSPSFRRDEICSFHDSLMIEPRNENGTGSRILGSAPERTKQEAFTRSISSSQVEERSVFMRDLFDKLKRKISPKKHHVIQQHKHSNAIGSTSNRSSVSSGNHGSECSCKRYHSHRFSGQTVNSDLEARKEKRQELILGSMNVQIDQGKDSLDDPRNIFWTPALSFHPYRHGDKRVAFASLWPKYKELREHLQNSGVQQTVLGPDSIMDVCTLACTCGPAHLLQCLVELELIRIDQVLESGSGLLHLALIAHNVETAQYLMAAKISPKIRDNRGLTADQVCYNSTIRKQMAPRYLVNRDVSRDRILLKPSLQDKDTIFRLASSPKNFVEIQKKLQTLDFNVNTECDNNGDFLLHIAVQKGLSQLPLLMALVKIQKADIELCNVDGMTSLMLAAAVGNCVLCDVLICLFGADPNKGNTQSGRSALHYAAEGNHRKTVDCLIRRGADINMEDHDGLRADDVPSCAAATDDCREVILFNRTNRLEMLSDLVKKGEVVSSQLLVSDLCVVDGDGNTLIMIAATYNRYHTLHCLLDVSKATINAQHSKTGMTALAIAAKMGNVEAVTILLRHKALPTIADMSGYLPLHQAVMSSHENVVDVFLDYFPDAYVGLYQAIRLCKKTSLHAKLKSAWEKRQEEIVTPKLLGCALNGDAEELFLLLDEGDNINPKSGTGNWPMYLAVENGHLEVVKLLFERGGDIRKRHPTTGATSLHLAAKMGHLSIISYLLQFCRKSHKNDWSPDTTPAAPSESDQPHGRRRRFLDINAVDRDSKTALQLAAEKGFSKIVDLLLAQGATTALLDSQGNLVTCPQFEGVRIMIEASRKQHTHQIIKAIEDKSKKALSLLQQIWLPKFDHHLRNKEGSTPLMVAAETGKVPIIQFLLESAVYPEVTQYESDSSDSDSDADSGLLDPSSTSPRDHSRNEDDFQASLEGVSVSYTIRADPQNESKQEYFNSTFKGRGLCTPDSSEFHQRRITQIVSDANKPKGQSIYHDGLISHVCAVNLHDGTNVLHHVIRGADAPHILSLFIDVDPTPLNMQDNRGETVLHLACRLKRKKHVEMILARPDLDLNIRTFDGLLPEEVTSSKAIQKMVGKVRAASSCDLPEQSAQILQNDISICGSEKTASISASTVNFDKLHSRYEILKNDSRPE